MNNAMGSFKFHLPIIVVYGWLELRMKILIMNTENTMISYMFIML